MPGALRYRDYRLFWTGSIVSQVGVWMQSFALGWLVVQLAIHDGSASLSGLYLGLNGLAHAVPTIILMPIAGGIADRRDQRTMLLLAQLPAVALTAVLALLVWTAQATLAAVLIVSAALSAARAFDLPVRWTMTGRLVPRDQLMSAIGLQSMSFNLPQIVGPGLGGLLIGPLGLGGVLAVSTVGFAAMVGSLLLMNPVPPVTGRSRSPVLRSVGEGLLFAARDPVIRVVVLMCVAVAFFARPYTSLLPATAATVLASDATGLSWLLSANGLGGVIGAGIVAGLGRLRRRGLAFLAVAAAAGLSVTAASFQSALEPALALAVVVGAGAMMFSGLSNSVIQVVSPERYRGRIISLYTTVFVGVIPLGTLALGSFASAVGVERTLAVAGIVPALVAGAIITRMPPVRELRSTSDPRPEPVTLGRFDES